jgi:hypothetical protein
MKKLFALFILFLILVMAGFVSCTPAHAADEYCTVKNELGGKTQIFFSEKRDGFSYSNSGEKTDLNWVYDTSVNRVIIKYQSGKTKTYAPYEFNCFDRIK